MSKLKLVSVTTGEKNPTVLRRSRLTAQIEVQLAAAIAGKISETGERSLVSISKKIKPWWFILVANKANLILKYGSKKM